MPNVVTLDDYATYGRRNPFSRQCPHYRDFFPGMSRSLNPFGHEGDGVQRRLAFLAILVLRFLHIILFTRQLNTSLWSVPLTLLNILFFLFTAWNLHLIVDMQGERIVFARRFGRAAFDGFLWLMAACHLGVLIWDFVKGYLVCEAGAQCAAAIGSASAIWSVLVLAIFLVAWVATWEPEDGPLTLA
ncbi:hypothetical protein EJ04DRAFT_523474 [Polyplosphaeria fusca]|uniref:Uncharacterized protein n=1 Tax=Polyplosphaeria fusca TaxID=682080 RepID=A0A9P4R045_9PLEO|nr:hypothetical protein EJ04DRAFT_523474 [Polyplosphaeria fusca]